MAKKKPTKIPAQKPSPKRKSFSEQKQSGRAKPIVKPLPPIKKSGK